MSLANKMAKRIGEKNPEFKKVWEDPSRKKQFELSCGLIELRNRVNMTQVEFANHVGLKQSYISRLENGQVGITVEKLNEIAEKLGGHATVSFTIDEEKYTSV